ncbi:type II secretion system F family protein [bacterium]|nr:type II secretion system F family protein [bacterium]
MVLLKGISMFLFAFGLWLILTFVYQTVSFFYLRYKGYYEQMVTKTTSELGGMFIKVKEKQMGFFLILGMLMIGVFVYFMTNNIVLAIFAVAGSAALPRLFVQFARMKRIKKFEEQLIEALILLSNALKAGLDLTQGMQLIVRDMPSPISDEFRLVLQETNIGSPLENSLENLAKRINSELVQFIVTAMVIQRESGGDITKILDQVVRSIRDNYTLLRKVQVLTAQGILESIVSFILPWGLAAALSVLQPGFMSPLFNNPIGIIVLIAATGWQIIGIFIVFKMSKIKV